MWGRRGLGRIGGWQDADVARALRGYEAVGRDLRRCLRATEAKAARGYLGFLVNRVECTVLHLRAIREMTGLQPICLGKKPADLSAAQRRRVRRTCDRALRLMETYLAHHAETVADRGCEGTLVNYETVPPAVVRRIRREFGGAGADGPRNGSPPK